MQTNNKEFSKRMRYRLVHAIAKFIDTIEYELQDHTRAYEQIVKQDLNLREYDLITEQEERELHDIQEQLLRLAKKWKERHPEDYLTAAKSGMVINGSYVKF